jgi:hypothetical protein
MYTVPKKFNLSEGQKKQTEKEEKKIKWKSLCSYYFAFYPPIYKPSLLTKQS